MAKIGSAEDSSAAKVSDLPDQSTDEDGPTGPLSFSIRDLETPAANLVVSGRSSDTGLVPEDSLLFGGSGISRTLTITPAANLSGQATITIFQGGHECIAEAALSWIEEIATRRKEKADKRGVDASK